MHPWWIHVMLKVELARVIQDPSSFTLFPPWVSQSPVPPRVVVLSSLQRLSINTFSRGILSTLQSLSSDQTWVSSTTRGQRVTFGDCLHTLFKWYELRVGHLGDNREGWGILARPSPPDWAYLQSTSFIGRIFPSLQTGGRHGLSFYRRTDYGLVHRMR